MIGAVLAVLVVRAISVPLVAGAAAAETVDQTGAQLPDDAATQAAAGSSRTDHRDTRHRRE
jgi:hypothetical protein